MEPWAYAIDLSLFCQWNKRIWSLRELMGVMRVVSPIDGD